MAERGASTGVRILQVGHDVVPTLGGIAQAVSDVHRALGGAIISLTNPSLIADGRGDSVLHIAQSGSPAGRAYGWSPGATAVASHLFADCDAVLIHGLFRHHYGWAAELARRHGKPCLIFPHGALDPYVFSYRGVQKKIWWRLVGTPVAQRSAGIVFMSARERDKASARTGDVASFVVHLPVVPPPPQPAAERDLARARVNAGPNDRIILFLGRLDPFKRIPVIIDAFQRARPPHHHLVIAGPDGPGFTRDECRRLIGPDMTGRIHVVGPLYGQDKHAMMAAADGFVNVSARENFGYALCEALAAGLPSIVGPGNDMAPEIAADSVWRLPGDDAATLAEKFLAFAATPSEKLRSMGEAGSRWAREKLSAEHFRSSLQRVVLSAIASPPPSARA